MGPTSQQPVSRQFHVPVVMLFSFALLSCGVLESQGLVANACVQGSGSCGAQCRQLTCQALVEFFHSTNSGNGTLYQTWSTKAGWEDAAGRTCGDILRRPPAAPPEYCDWYGVVCCYDGMVRANKCDSLHSVLFLEISVNGLTGNISSPQFLQAITQLHTCGLTQLMLDGNSLYGSFSDEWGQLANLTGLNMGKTAGWNLFMSLRYVAMICGLQPWVRSGVLLAAVPCYTTLQRCTFTQTAVIWVYYRPFEQISLAHVPGQPLRTVDRAQLDQRHYTRCTAKHEKTEEACP